MSLIEVAVSLVILAAVVVPVAHVIISTATTTNQERLTTEAVGLADQLMENVSNEVKYQSLAGIVGNPRTVHLTTVLSNNASGTRVTDTFRYRMTYSLVFEGGSSVCASAGGASPPQIYKVTVLVGWIKGNYAVRQATYIAPQGVGLVPQDSGELAVPVDGTNGQPYTVTSVPVSVTGAWTGPGIPPSVPSGQVTSTTVWTDDTGCAAFTNLDAATGWSYTYELGAGSGVVTYQEYPGAVNTGIETVPMPPVNAPGVVIGEAVVAQPLIVDGGDNLQISFHTVGFSSGANVIAPAAILPFTVQDANLPGPNQSFSFDTLASGTPQSCPPAATPCSIVSALLYPYPYAAWAGDTLDSNPSYPVGGNPDYTGAVITGLDTTQPVQPVSLSLPVYPLVISTTSPTGGKALTATEVSSPNETISLNLFTSSGSTSTSSTGLPLGQYQLGFPGGPVSPDYVWVTPSGVYSSAAPQAQPSGAPVAPGTAIRVTL